MSITSFRLLWPTTAIAQSKSTSVFWSNLMQVGARVFLREGSYNGVIICPHEQNRPVALCRGETGN